MDGHLTAEEHIARIETRVHLHRRDARHALTCHDSVLNRRRPAQLRQEGSMHVDTAVYGYIEHLLREDLTERHDDGKVGRERAQLRDKVRIARTHGLHDGNIMRERPHLDGRRAELLSTPARTVGLRNDGDDLGEIAARGNRRKCRHGEVRRPHKDDTHSRHPFFSSLRRLTAISMKSLPSRWSHSC